jgi:hypothetical protein
MSATRTAITKSITTAITAGSITTTSATIRQLRFRYTPPSYTGGHFIGETDWIYLGSNGRTGGAFVMLYGTVNASQRYDAAQQHVLQMIVTMGKDGLSRRATSAAYRPTTATQSLKS